MLSDNEPLTLIFTCCNGGRRKIVQFSEFRSLPIGETNIVCERHGAVTFDQFEYVRMINQQSGPYELTLRPLG